MAYWGLFCFFKVIPYFKVNLATYTACYCVIFMHDCKNWSLFFFLGNKNLTVQISWTSLTDYNNIPFSSNHRPGTWFSVGLQHILLGCLEMWKWPDHPWSFEGLGRFSPRSSGDNLCTRWDQLSTLQPIHQPVQNEIVSIKFLMLWMQNTISANEIIRYKVFIIQLISN